MKGAGIMDNYKQKQVLSVEMYGRKLIIRHVPGAEYEYRVYDVISPAKVRHIESFESFQQALECVEYELYA